MVAGNSGHGGGACSEVRANECRELSRPGILCRKTRQEGFHSDHTQHRAKAAQNIVSGPM